MASGTVGEARWYYRTAGKEFGPVTFHDLDQRTRAREILLDSEVKLDVDGLWQSILKIAHLLPAIASEAKARGISLEELDAAAPKPVTVAPDKVWFRKRGADLIGPHSLVEMRAMALSSQFVPGDEFRESPTAPWRSLADVQSLFFPGGAGTQPRPKPAPVAPAPPQEPEHAKSVSVTAGPGVVSDGLLSGGGGFFSGLWEFYLLPILLIVARQIRNFWFIPAGLVLWFAVNYFLVSWFSIPSTQESFSRLTLIHEQLIKHQKNKFTGPEWETYRKQAASDIKPIIRGLQNAANVVTPGTQHLLWAARDCVEPIVSGDNRSDEKMTSLTKHLYEARVQMSRTGSLTY